MAQVSRGVSLSFTLLAGLVLSACTSQQAPKLKEGEKPVDVAAVVRQKNARQRQRPRGPGPCDCQKPLTARSWRRRKKNVCSVLAVAQQGIKLSGRSGGAGPE